MEYRVIKKASDQTITSTSYTSDADLTFTVLVNSTYHVSLYLEKTHVESNDLQSLGQMEIQVPAGASIRVLDSLNDATSYEYDLWTLLEKQHFALIIDTAGTAGNVTVRWKVAESGCEYDVLAATMVTVTKMVTAPPAPGTFLLHTNETPVTEITSSTAESSALRTYNLVANTYDHILVEAEVRNRVEQDASTRCDFTWRFKVDGVTTKTFVNRIIAMNTANVDSGGRFNERLSMLIAGGQIASTALTITSRNSLSNGSTGAQLVSFRVWGIRLP
jgi:hypothetical protein